jgi:hypothetical protein
MTTPLVAAALLSVAGCSLAIHLAVAPDPFASSSAAVIAIGAVMFAIIAVVGLVLVRGRWARWMSVALALAIAGITAVGEFDVWSWIALFTALAGLGVLLGRWLDGWIRARPSATGPDPKVVVLLLGLLAIVPAVGLAAPGGLQTAHGVLGAGAVLLAWAYGKAQVWSLWAIRLVLPVLGIAAAIASPPAGAALLLVLVGGVVGLAWTPEALLAAQPLMDDAPGPRKTRTDRERSEQ